VGYGGFVPFQAVARYGGRVQQAVGHLEGARQHRVGPVLPLQSVRGRVTRSRCAETSGYRCEDNGHVADDVAGHAPGLARDPGSCRLSARRSAG
jgi:hypothetical protein